MKFFNKGVILSLLLLLHTYGFAQIAPDTAKINFIKREFTSINGHLANYKKIAKQDSVQTTEGNEILAYFDGSEIKKISAIYYGETGKLTSEYYFSNKKLIFYFSQNANYDLPIYSTKTPGKIASTKEERYYFYNDALIKFLYNPIKKPSSSAIDKVSIETQKETKRLLALVSNRSNK